MGATGRGVAEHFGLLGEIDVITSTLGKALGGAAGGFVAASEEVCELLAQRSRPQLFSNALPPTVACSALEAVRVLRREPELVERLRGLSERLPRRGCARSASSRSTARRRSSRSSSARPRSRSASASGCSRRACSSPASASRSSRRERRGCACRCRRRSSRAHARARARGVRAGGPRARSHPKGDRRFVMAPETHADVGDLIEIHGHRARGDRANRRDSRGPRNRRARALPRALGGRAREHLHAGKRRGNPARRRRTKRKR